MAASTQARRGKGKFIRGANAGGTYEKEISMAQQSVEDERSKVGVVFWVSSAVSAGFHLCGV